MRWLRRVLVTVVLVAPIAVVAAVAWPDEGATRGDPRADGSGPDGALVAGDDVNGEVGAGQVAEWRLVADGGVVVGVRGVQPFDPVLTVRDADGDVLVEVDDTNGLDPETDVDVDGQAVVEVRGYDESTGGAFSVYVE